MINHTESNRQAKVEYTVSPAYLCLNICCARTGSAEYGNIIFLKHKSTN